MLTSDDASGRPTQILAPNVRSSVIWTVCTIMIFVGAVVCPASENFIRGDANVDGEVDISDALATLGFLFRSDPATIACDDAADANDDGGVDISDAIATLNFLFVGNGEIPAPGANSCGPDPTTDPLSCAQFSVCSDGAEEARVTNVTVSGAPGAYTFSVTVTSPDTGCERYADWWEVATPEGELLYRRVLLHSHVTEQPFTRSGGPVPIQPGDVVVVRAHMSDSGYSRQGFRGSVEAGVEEVELEPDFAPDLALEPPLPTNCAF